MLKAVTRQASLVDTKLATINAQNLARGRPKVSTAYFFDHYATEQDTAVMVTGADFENAARELVPSVSVKELQHYKRVRAQFEKPEEGKDDGGKGKGVLRTAKGLSSWQEQHENRPKTNGKGKGKAIDKRGKGKERAWDVDEEEEETHDNRLSNGVSVNKGKGKVLDVEFQQGTAEDDEDLY